MEHWQGRHWTVSHAPDPQLHDLSPFEAGSRYFNNIANFILPHAPTAGFVVHFWNALLSHVPLLYTFKHSRDYYCKALIGLFMYKRLTNWDPLSALVQHSYSYKLHSYKYIGSTYCICITIYLLDQLKLRTKLFAKQFRESPLLHTYYLCSKKITAFCY